MFSRNINVAVLGSKTPGSFYRPLALFGNAYDPGILKQDVNTLSNQGGYGDILFIRQSSQCLHLLFSQLDLSTD